MPQNTIAPLTSSESWIRKVLYGLLFVLPFSPLIVTAISKLTGHHLVLDAWKEIFLFLVFIVLCFVQKHRLSQVFKSRLTLSIVVYVLYLGVISLVHNNTLSSGAGFVFAVRFLLAFAVGVLSSSFIEPQEMSSKITKVAAVVCMVGTLILVLPNSLLTHIGYDAPGVDTVNNPASIYYVSDSLKIERMMASLKGPNSLGLYLLLPIAIALFAGRKKSGSLIALLGLSIALTFSRSAFIGLLVIMGYRVWTRRKSLSAKARSLPRSAILTIATSIIVVAFVSLPYANRLLLHQDAGQRNGSTSARISLYQEDVRDIIKHPLGHGLGTASLAGRVSGSGVQVSENYYLQIAKESGVIGLLLLLVIAFYTYKYVRSSNTLVQPILLSSLFAMLVANIFIPVWADEIVAISWWLFAGIVLGPQLLGSARQKHRRSDII